MIRKARSEKRKNVWYSGKGKYWKRKRGDKEEMRQRVKIRSKRRGKKENRGRKAGRKEGKNDEE